MSLPELLVNQSMLTPRQVEVLQTYLRVALGEIGYREAASNVSKGRRRGKPGPVTVGSFFRTVQQAKGNVRRSIVTLLIAIWLGLVRSEDVRKLLDKAAGNVADLSEEEKERFVAVLHALLQEVVV